MTLRPLQYTLTHRLLATNSFPPSLFRAWFLFITSLSLPPFFSSPPLYTAGCSCLRQIHLLPSKPLSLSFSAPLCIFVFFPLSSPLPLFSSSCSISFTADYLSLSPFYLPPFFLSILLPSVFLRPLFSAVFTALLSACSLLLLLFSSATSHPLFSPCLSLSPFLFSQPLSPSLWVSGLCGGSQPPVGHPAGEKS